MQDEIAAKVGEALRVALLGADSKPVRTSSETSIDIYSDYLLARQKLANPNYETLAAAERLLKSVIERDPEYAPAYAELANAYEIMGGWGRIPGSEAWSQMLPLAEKALSLDDRLADGWLLLSIARRKNGDLKGARAARERALELDPRNPLVLRHMMEHWSLSHEPERGLVYADELLRVDPLSPLNLLIIAYLDLRLGRFAEMERTLERSRSIDPKSVIYLWGASILAISRGDLVGAIRLLEDCAKADPADWETPSFIAMSYFDLGDVIAAKYWSEATLKVDPRAPWAKLVLALLHLDRHEEAEAIELAREITQPGAMKRRAQGAALRIANAPNLAAGHYEEIITEYLTDYPELRDAKVPIEFSTEHLGSSHRHAGSRLRLPPGGGRGEGRIAAFRSRVGDSPLATNSGMGFGDTASQMSISTPCAVTKRRLWRLSARARRTARDSCGGCNSFTTRTWNPSEIHPNLPRSSPRSKPTWPPS